MEENTEVSQPALDKVQDKEVKDDAVVDCADDSVAVQTVYTNLTPVTIQDESGLRQVYVPVEQADTLTSLALGDSSGTNPLSGIPGQLITITLPPGTSSPTDQLQITDGATLVSLQQDAVISLPTEIENDRAEQIVTNVIEDPVVSQSESNLQDIQSSNHGEIGAELLDSLLDHGHNDQPAPDENKSNETQAKKSEEFTAYIRTLLTQTGTANESSSQEESDGHLTDGVETTHQKPKAKELPEVFSSIEATLSSALLDAIPGTKSVYLHKIQGECSDIEVREKDEQVYSLICPANQLVTLYDRLSNLLPTAKHPFHHKQLRHKGVNCDLLRPMFSRSGREVKPKQYEIPVDDDPVSNSNIHVPKLNSVGKRKKRGRPPKVRKVCSGDNKNNVNKVTLKDTTNIIESSQHMEKSSQEIKDKKTNDTSKTLQSVEIAEDDKDHHTEFKTEIELDSDPVNMEVITLTQNEALVKIEDVQEDNIDGENLDEGYDAALIRPVSHKKVKFIKKKPKKDYESLLPFKFFCSQCSFKSKRQSHFRKHMELHERGLQLLHCSECSFTTIRLSHLKRHTLFHTSELHKCKYCKYETYEVQHLNRHLRVKHPSSKELTVKEVFECPMCEYMTPNEYQYKRHLKVHAEVNGGIVNTNRIVSSYQCPICPYATKKKDHFARHIKQVHTEHRPYLCDLCGKSFKRQDTLRCHKVVHMDKALRFYSFKCTMCSKQFRTQAHLTEHMTSHSNSRQYLCEICGSSFKTRNVQRKHVRTIHMKPRSHKCSDCEKSFNTKFALQRHARTHDTPGMRKVKQVLAGLESIKIAEPVLITPTTDITGFSKVDQDVQELTEVSGVAEIHQISEVQEHHIPISTELHQQQITIPVTADGALPQHITIPISADMQQDIPATIHIADAAQTAGLTEGTYHTFEQDADGSLRQLPHTYIQTNEATTALLYLPNFRT